MGFIIAEMEAFAEHYVRKRIHRRDAEGAEKIYGKGKKAGGTPALPNLRINCAVRDSRKPGTACRATAALGSFDTQWELAGTTAAVGNAVVWSRMMRQPSGNFLKSREKTPEGWSASRMRWNFPTT